MNDLINISLINTKIGVIISSNKYKQGDVIGNYEVIKTVVRPLYKNGFTLNYLKFGFESLNKLVSYYADINKKIFIGDLNFIVLRGLK